MGLNDDRKKICLSLPGKDLVALDNLCEFLTSYYGYRFTRTSSIQYLLKYYRDNFKIDGDFKEGIRGQIKITPF